MGTQENCTTLNDHEVLAFTISTAFKQMLRVHPMRDDAMHP
jgi:hypothetical protein